ncbi:MAG TPA: family 1 encapsulin nanocompartment shell protein [Acidimicrobiia bacterium]|nr:family 1 encapsulin nanocompartment shell protein [Acidimicrobiia bacterium]
MTHLHRELAPISEKAWAEIDREAARTLRTFLAARQLMDFSGPHGWEYAADSLGSLERVGGPVEGVEAGVRVVQPLVELRHAFSLPRTTIDDIDRGRPDPDLARVIEAAKRAALAEDRIVFHGFKEAHITGVVEAAPHPGLEIDDNYSGYPKLVARAVALLREAGIDGPYAAALGPRCWTGVIETTEHGGYPVLEHLRLILGGPVVWAPAVDGAVVLSTRGEDFQLSCGQDMALGYLSHDADSVNLFLEESIGFRVLTPEAAVPLVHLG